MSTKLGAHHSDKSDPVQIVDTPEEVCINMREEDFGTKYVLNVYLMDYLIENRNRRDSELKSALTYISRNFGQSESFLIAFYNQGEHLGHFIKELCEHWPDFSKMAVLSNNHSAHVSHILKFADQSTLLKKMNPENVLSDYIGEKGHLVFVEKTQQHENYNTLSQLRVKFKDLALLDSIKELQTFAIDNCLYDINSKNIVLILRREQVKTTKTDMAPEKSNYSMIMTSKEDSFKGYIEENISDYIANVFLKLPENFDENVNAILSLLNNSTLKDSVKRDIISKQNHTFNSFENLPSVFWSQLLEEDKITLSWKITSEYLDAFESEEKVLTQVMQSDVGLKYFSNTPINASELGDEKSKQLSRFILNNDALGDNEYGSLIKSIPYRYTTFPSGVNEEKLDWLVSLSKITLTEESFEFCKEKDSLKVKLISKNIATYLSQKEKYEIDDDIREGLLKSEISKDQKMEIALDLEHLFVASNISLSTLLNELFLSIETIPTNLDNKILSSAIVNASDTTNAVKLLLRSISRWNEASIMEMLSVLDKPFNEISKYGKHPKIPKNKTNLDFLTALKSKGYISSFRDKSAYYRVNTYKSKSH